MSFTLPQLAFQYNALEPFLDEQTMTIHHTKHHQAYLDKLNDALKGLPDFSEKPIEELLINLDTLPEEKRNTIRNNGGGHFNHSKFWEWMNPPTGGENKPQGELLEAINSTFESFEKFKELFSNAGLGRFGSGWIWLATKDNKLSILSTPNQDNPLTDNSGMPILGLDVWEHAYYLKYQNRRAEYIEAWWNIVNWNKVTVDFNENNS